MARPEDPRKHAEWRKRLKRFEKSGQTIAEFCEAEGVAPVPIIGGSAGFGYKSERQTLPAESEQSANPSVSPVRGSLPARGKR